MKKAKNILLTILEKGIIFLEFVWATWFGWLLVIAGVFAVYRYFVTNQTNYLFGILIIIVGVWSVIDSWREYLKEHKRD